MEERTEDKQTGTSWAFLIKLEMSKHRWVKTARIDLWLMSHKSTLIYLNRSHFPPGEADLCEKGFKTEGLWYLLVRELSFKRSTSQILFKISEEHFRPSCMGVPYLGFFLVSNFLIKVAASTSSEKTFPTRLFQLVSRQNSVTLFYCKFRFRTMNRILWNTSCKSTVTRDMGATEWTLTYQTPTPSSLPLR